MFDLTQAAQEWAERVHGPGPRSQARIDELVDHLLCTTDELVQAGLDPAGAFQQATERLGSPDDLAREHRREQWGLSCMFRGLMVLCCGDEDAKRALLGRKQASAALIGVSLLAAAVMLMQAAFFYQQDNSTVTYVIIAIWFVPYSALSQLAAPDKRNGNNQLS